MPITSRLAAISARAYGMFSNLARAVDPFFNYVTALLHGDGTNGAQNNTFLDSSTNNFTITRNGNTTQGAFSPFSQTGWSNYFDGTANYAISAPAGAAFAFGTGDFTVEGWIYTTNLAGENFIFDTRSSASTAGMGFSIEPSTGKLRYSGSANNVLTSVGITANIWYHVAWVRSGTTLTGYINGVNCGTATNSDNITQNNGVVGRVAFSTASSTGYLSNVRVVKGTAVYTSNFTPSTTPLTSITNTSLLTCQSNRFIDNSTNAFAITVTGSPSVQAFSPFNPTSAWSASFNGGSGYFDGSGDYLSLASNAAFAVAGQYTVEFWAYQTAAPTNYASYFLVNVSNGLQIGFNTAGGGVFGVANNLIGWQLTTAAFPLNAWTHIAITRDASNVTRIFYNGVLQTSGTITTSYTQGATVIGFSGPNNGYITGYVSDLRFVNGTAVYTANFTPPTAPLTAITNTQLLLNYTNAGIYDNAAVGDYETVGTAQVNTTVKKYGTGSIYCNGTGNYLSYPSRPQFDFGTGDFTIECWVYVTSVATTYQCICQFGDAATTTGFHLLANTNTICLRTNSSQPITTGAVIAANTWYHVALSRVASQTRIFVNGTASGSTYNWTASLSSGSTRLIGADIYANPLTGYIDDFRITKGVGRYIYNFTPPAAALPDIGGTVTLTADPYFRNTTLLLPGNGTNGAQNNTFLDSSSNVFTITRNGNTTQGNFSPFSQTGWGNYFSDGTSTLSLADATQFNLSGGSYTLEAWIYPNGNYTGYNTVIAKRVAASSTTAWEIYLRISTGVLSFFNGTNIESSVTPPANQWSHVAAVYDGTNINLYLNGTRVLQTAISNTNVAASVYIGNFNNAEQFIGYISNVRVTKGGALYTANFTPPITPLTTTVSAGTVSLLTCQSNRFLDNSANAFAITATGSPSVQAFSPFAPTAAWSAATNGGSGYFDGSGDYLFAASNAAFGYGTGDFTIEMWVYPTVISASTPNLLDQRTSNPQVVPTIYLNAGVLSYYVSGANRITGATLTAGQWYHIALCRASGSTKLFLNGVQTGSTYADTNNYITSPVTVFVDGTGGGTYQTGYCADLRIVKGTAVYTAAFTPPTAPLTTISGTSLLLSATNGGIVDATAKNDLETVGNAQISTTQSKFGGSSMAFDGTGDWLSSPNGQNYNLGSGDFTIECWVYANNLSSLYGIFGKRVDTGVETKWVCSYINTTGTVQTQLSTSGAAWLFNTATTSTITSGSWNHIAWVRYGADFSVYVNGIKNTMTTTLSGSVYTDASALIIGATGTTGAYILSMNGYVDDFRITKGIARYTSNFTPPTTAFLTL